jgi:hypothetical protein
LHSDVVDYLKRTVPIVEIDALNLNGAEQSLDAIVIAYGDLQRVPALFETPLLLVGTNAEYNLAPPYQVSEFISADAPCSTQGAVPSAGPDMSALEQKLQSAREKVQYVRSVRRIFGDEFKVDESALQDTIQEGEARSLFDAHYLFCKDFVQDTFDRVKTSPDRESADKMGKKIALFAAEVKDMSLLDELLDLYQKIGISSAINKALESPSGQELVTRAPEFLPALLAFFAPEMKEAPVGKPLHRYSHSVTHVPGASAYIKHAQGQQRAAIRNEIVMLGKYHQNLKRVREYLKRSSESAQASFLSLPQMLFFPAKAIAEKVDYDALVLSELPGEQLASYLYAQHRELQAIEDKKEREAKAKALEPVREAVLTDVAKFTALAYALAKLEGDEMLHRVFSKKPEKHLDRLRLRFIGDPDGDADFGGLPGGLRKAFKGGASDEIELYAQTLLQNIGPVLDVIVQATPGVDTDRTALNLLIERPQLRIHNVDFGTFRDYPLLQNWVHASLLLSNYDNCTKQFDKDYVFGNERQPLFRKGEQRPWHVYSIFEFMQQFQAQLGVVRKALSVRKPAARNALRFSLPPSTDVAREFYALSVYQSGIHFGYLERLRDPRHHNVDFIDFMQHELIENQRYSIRALEQWSTRQEQESMRGPNDLLYSASERLHDAISMRMQHHDH